MAYRLHTVTRARQGGATLVIALLVLVLIMMIGITAVTTSNTQYKLAGNLQFEDDAINRAESAVAAAEQWLSTGTNYSNAGFTTFAVGATPHLKPIGHMAAQAAPANNPLTMEWVDATEDAATANSLMVGGNVTQRYLIELMSRNNRLQGSSQVVGGRTSSGCNQVNTYQITGRGTSARGAVRYVQSYYSVLSCT